MCIYYNTRVLIICIHKLHVALLSTEPSIRFLNSHIFLFSGLTLHIMSKNAPLNFIMTLSSSKISACKYAPGTSNMYTYRFSVASITSVVVSDYIDTVGDDMVLISFIDRFCFLPSTHVLPLIFPLFKKNMTASTSPWFSLGVRPSGLMVKEKVSWNFSIV